MSKRISELSKPVLFYILFGVVVMGRWGWELWDFEFIYLFIYVLGLFYTLLSVILIKTEKVTGQNTDLLSSLMFSLLCETYVRLFAAQWHHISITVSESLPSQQTWGVRLVKCCVWKHQCVRPALRCLPCLSVTQPGEERNCQVASVWQCYLMPLCMCSV